MVSFAVVLMVRFTRLHHLWQASHRCDDDGQAADHRVEARMPHVGINGEQDALGIIAVAQKLEGGFDLPTTYQVAVRLGLWQASHQLNQLLLGRVSIRDGVRWVLHAGANSDGVCSANAHRLVALDHVAGMPNFCSTGQACLQKSSWPSSMVMAAECFGMRAPPA
jgi:hypothetical protein